MNWIPPIFSCQVSSLYFGLINKVRLGNRTPRELDIIWVKNRYNNANLQQLLTSLRTPPPWVPSCSGSRVRRQPRKSQSEPVPAGPRFVPWLQVFASGVYFPVLSNVGRQLCKYLNIWISENKTIFWRVEIVVDLLLEEHRCHRCVRNIDVCFLNLSSVVRPLIAIACLDYSHHCKMMAFTLGMRHRIGKSLSVWEIYILIKLYIFEPLSNFRYTCLFILAFVDCLFLNILYGKDMIGYSSAQLNLNIKMIFCICYLYSICLD